MRPDPSTSSSQANPADSKSGIAALERVGEHKSFESGEEFLDSSDAEVETKETAQEDGEIKSLQTLESEFDQLAKRSYVVRRGRNNRLLVRPILEKVFEEGPGSYELSYGLPG